MDSTLVLLANALLYTIVLLIVWRKKGLSVGLLIWALFTVSSWASWLFVQQPHFRGTIHDNPMNPYSLGYLFILLYICISPLFNLCKMEYGSITIKHEKFLEHIIVFIGIYQIIVFLVDLPQIGNIINSPDLGDLRENVYDGNNSNVSKIPLLNRFNLIYSGFKPISVALSLVLFFCLDRHKKLTTFFLITNILSIFNEVIVMVSRGIMVNYAMYLGILLFYIRDFLSPRVKKAIIAYVIPVAFIMLTFFWAISVSRFGDLANFMMYKYLGEPMVNFGGYMFDIQGQTNCHGYFLSPFFRDFITCEEKWYYVENIVKIPIFIFYTFIGELVVEFGKVGAVIGSLFIMRLQYLLLNRSNSFAFFFPLFLLIYAFSYGVFIFPIQGFQGFFFMFFTIIFYNLFKDKNYENWYSDVC